MLGLRPGLTPQLRQSLRQVLGLAESLRFRLCSPLGSRDRRKDGLVPGLLSILKSLTHSTRGTLFSIRLAKAASTY